MTDDYEYGDFTKFPEFEWLDTTYTDTVEQPIDDIIEIIIRQRKGEQVVEYHFPVREQDTADFMVQLNLTYRGMEDSTGFASFSEAGRATEAELTLKATLKGGEKETDDPSTRMYWWQILPTEVATEIEGPHA